MVRTGILAQGFILAELSKIVLDTGASNGNYVGAKVLIRSGMDERKCRSCNREQGK